MYRFFLLLLFILPKGLLSAPPPAPSAGVVEREIQQEYEEKPLEIEKDIPSVEVDIPEERLTFPTRSQVLIREILIVGNEALTCFEIQSYLQKYLNQKQTIEDIYSICKKIDQLYASKGYFLARAYPPPQKIKNGVLTLHVLEGRIGNIRIEGNQFYSEKFIYNYFKSFRSQPLRYKDFLKALLLLNENSDLYAGVIFEKGKEVGTADLLVKIIDKRPIHLYLNENNYGRLLTTHAQLGGRFDWGNCLTYGDTFSIAEVVGFPVSALYFTDARYYLPLNSQGTSMEFACLFTKFHIEELQSLHLRGESLIATLKANQAMKRTKTVGIDIFGYFDYKQIQNFVLGQRTSYDRLRVVTVGALIDHYNSARGRDYLNIRVAAGIPDFLGGMSSVSQNSSRIGGGGRFAQINLDYDRVQQVYKELMLYLHASGQWSPYKLTLPQQLYIGGASSVRGYPLSVALGDSGYYGNFEIRSPLPVLFDKKFFWTKRTWKEAFQMVGFVDTGATFFNQGPKTFITGAGCGFRILGPYSLSVSFDIGFPLMRSDLSTGAFNYLKITAQPF